jgi:hypothetical protein
MDYKFKVGDKVRADNNELFILIKEHPLYMGEVLPRFDIISLNTQEIQKHCYLYNNSWFPVFDNDAIKPFMVLEDIKSIRDYLNAEITECNTYLEKRNDSGQVQRPDDPFEFISYTRGKSIGLILGRDKINNILNKNA